MKRESPLHCRRPRRHTMGDAEYYTATKVEYVRALASFLQRHYLEEIKAILRHPDISGHHALVIK